MTNELFDGCLAAEDVAEQLGASLATVKRWCSVGKRGVQLRHMRTLYNRIFIDPADLKEFMYLAGAASARRTVSNPVVRKRRAATIAPEDVTETQNRLAKRGV